MRYAIKLKKDYPIALCNLGSALRQIGENQESIDVLLNAYSSEFSIDDEVSLIIKTFDNQHNNLLMELLHHYYQYTDEFLIYF